MQCLGLVQRALRSAAAAVLLCGQAVADENLKVLPADVAGGFDILVERAQEEGEVLVYGGPSAGKMVNWFAEFERQFGIPVQYYRASSNIVFQRFMQEQAAGRRVSDVLINSVRENLIRASEDGYLAEYTPRTATMFPVETTIPGIAWPAYLTMQTVAWNTNLVPEDLQEKLRADPLRALLDPRFKGRLAMVKISSGELPLAANANIVLNQPDAFGWPYLEALAMQEPLVVETGPAGLAAVVAGDVWATPDAADSIFGPAIVNGAPIAFAFPAIVAATEFQMAIAKNAPNPYAARLLMEWMTSPKAQAKLAEISQASVVIDGWTDTRKISKATWYRPPESLWFGFQDEPQLQDEARLEFYRRWLDLFGG